MLSLFASLIFTDSPLQFNSWKSFPSLIWPCIQSVESQTQISKGGESILIYINTFCLTLTENVTSCVSIMYVSLHSTAPKQFIWYLMVGIIYPFVELTLFSSLLDVVLLWDAWTYLICSASTITSDFWKAGDSTVEQCKECYKCLKLCINISFQSWKAKKRGAASMAAR